MSVQDRDRAIERLLAGASSGRSLHVVGECPGPEELAAWNDGALSADAAARLEGHAASCATCQELLATFVRSLPPAERRAPRTRPDVLRWVAPLAAAAAIVLAVWVTRGMFADPPLIVSDASAIREGISPGQETGAAATPPSSAPAPSPRSLAEGSSVAQPASPASTPAGSDLRPGASSKVDGGTGLPGEAAADRSRELVDRQERPAERAIGAVGDASDAATALVNARSATAAASPAASAERRAAGPDVPEARVSAPASAVSSAVGQSLNALARLRQPTTALSLAAPGGQWRWRRLTGNAMEVSSDGGRSWRPVQGPPDLLDAVTAGASPAARTLWLVGRGGLVLRTTDGERLDRVAAPTSSDLVGVDADDARRASVGDAGGGMWRTGDGGVSWTSVPAGP